jgi:chromosome segregation ATPase
MNIDIVTRLRKEISKRDRPYPVELLPELKEAADEIERLRVEALGTQRRIQDQDAIMAELWERIHALTAKRDEARREVCELSYFGKEDVREYAKHRGWDCFKEGG